MRPRLNIPPAFIAVAAALWGMYGAYRLEALAWSSALSPVEVAMVRAFGALIGGVFLMGLAYAQSLLRSRAAEPSAEERKSCK